MGCRSDTPLFSELTTVECASYLGEGDFVHHLSVLEHGLHFRVDHRLVEVEAILVVIDLPGGSECGITEFCGEHTAAPLLGLLEVSTFGALVGLRVLVDGHLSHLSVLVRELGVDGLDSHRERVTGERLEGLMPHAGDVLRATTLDLSVVVDVLDHGRASHDFVLFDAVHGERTNAQGHVAGGETVLLENFEHLLGTLDGDRVPVKGLYVRIEDLIALGVNRTTKDVPEAEYGLRNDFHAVTAVATDQEASLVVEKFVLEGREDVVDHVPVVVAVADTAERGFGVKLGESPLDEHTFTARVDVSVLVVGVRSDVVGAVRAHHEMLGGDGTESNLFLTAVAVVHLLQVGDYGDGGAVDKGQGPCGTSLASSIDTLVTTEVEVTKRTAGGDVIVAGLSVILVNDLAVGVAHGGADHRVPHFGGNEGFQSLSKPRKIGVGVGDAENRAVHRHEGALRQGEDLNGEVTQLVQVADLVRVADALAHGILHVEHVLIDHLVFVTGEEILLEVVDEPGLTESLETEVDHFGPPVDTAHSRSEIADGFRHPLGNHFGMDCLIEILKHQSVALEHSCVIFVGLLLRGHTEQDALITTEHVGGELTVPLVNPLKLDDARVAGNGLSLNLEGLCFSLGLGNLDILVDFGLLQQLFLLLSDLNEGEGLLLFQLLLVDGLLILIIVVHLTDVNLVEDEVVRLNVVGHLLLGELLDFLTLVGIDLDRGVAAGSQSEGGFQLRLDNVLFEPQETSVVTVVEFRHVVVNPPSVFGVNLPRSGDCETHLDTVDSRGPNGRALDGVTLGIVHSDVIVVFIGVGL